MTATRHYTDHPLGIIAGGGALPREIAECVHRRGGRVFVLSINGAADDWASRFETASVGIAQSGTAIKALKRSGVRDVLLVGTIQRPDFRKTRIDLGFLTVVPKAIRIARAGGDDALLRTVISLFEPRGFHVVSVPEVAPELMADRVSLANTSPSSKQLSDAAVGFDVVAALGRFDIGQGVIVNDGTVIAIEGADGTDAMLHRASEQRGDDAKPGGVLVKGAKPGQDLRVDLPTVGPLTPLGAAAAGLTGIAVEDGRVITVERETMLENAKASAVDVFAVTPQRQADAKQSTVAIPDLKARGVARADTADLALGVAVMHELHRFAHAPSLIVRRRRVYAIETQLTPQALLNRFAVRNTKKKRHGFLVVSSAALIDDALTTAAAREGLRVFAMDTGPS